MNESVNMILNEDTPTLESITNAVNRASNDVTDLLFQLNVKGSLYDNKMRDLKQFSENMYNLLRKRINVQDYFDLNEDNETLDSDSETDSNVILNSTNESADEDQDHNA